MYSIQWLMKGIDARNRIGAPRDLLYAAHPAHIFKKLEQAKAEVDKLGGMPAEQASMKAIEMNGSIRRTQMVIKRAMGYISSQLTRSCVDHALNQMTILQADLVTTYLGVSP